MNTKYKEGYCHMQYQNESKNKTITIWNSRDGVSPFSVLIDDEQYQHILWHCDRKDKNYPIKEGDYIFCTVGNLEAEKIANKTYDFYMNLTDEQKSNTVGGKDYFDKILSDKEEFIKNGIEDSIGHPYLVKITKDNIVFYRSYILSPENLNTK